MTDFYQQKSNEYQQRIAQLQQDAIKANESRYSAELALEAHCEDVNAWEFRRAWEQEDENCKQIASKLSQTNIQHLELCEAVEKGLDPMHFDAIQQAYAASPQVIVDASNVTHISWDAETLTATYKIVFPREHNRPAMHDLVDVTMNWDNEVDEVEIYGQSWC